MAGKSCRARVMGYGFVCLLKWVSRLNAFKFVTVEGYEARDALNLKKKKKK